MDPVVQLWLATGAFLVTHYVTSTPLRAALVRALGSKGYLGAYSLVAFATLGWMIWAYARAAPQPLWPGVRWLPAALMPIALILIVSGYTTRNPGAVMQEGALKRPEPARGILRVTRHPLMWGIMLFAAAHLLARGELKATIFFGGLLLLAASGSLLMDARKARTLGEDWKRFADVTSHMPFAAIAQGRNRFDAAEIGWKRPAIALALTALLAALHPWLFGSRPW